MAKKIVVRSVERTDVAKPELSWTEWGLLDIVLQSVINKKNIDGILPRGYGKLDSVLKKIRTQTVAQGMGFTYAGKPKMKDNDQ